MVNQFAFDVVAAFYCSTCDGVREVSTTVSAPVAEPLGFQLFRPQQSGTKVSDLWQQNYLRKPLHAIRPARDVETWPSEFPWRWRSGHATETAKADGEGIVARLTCGTADTYETYRSLYWLFIGSGVPEFAASFHHSRHRA